MIHHKLKFLNNGDLSFINSHFIAANGLKQACRSVSGIEEALILVKKKSSKMLDINKKNFCIWIATQHGFFSCIFGT